MFSDSPKPRHPKSLMGCSFSHIAKPFQITKRTIAGAPCRPDHVRCLAGSQVVVLKACLCALQLGSTQADQARLANSKVSLMMLQSSREVLDNIHSQAEQDHMQANPDGCTAHAVGWSMSMKPAAVLEECIFRPWLGTH